MNLFSNCIISFFYIYINFCLSLIIIRILEFFFQSQSPMVKSIFHVYFSLLCLAAVVVGVITTAAQEEEEEECKAVRCPDSGPLVRFPFWLKGYQPKRCGYPHPNFQLSCSSHSNTTTTTTVLELIHSVNFTSSSSIMYIPLKYRVLEIDYAVQRIHVSLDFKSVCLPSSPPAVNNLSSNTPPPPPPPPPHLMSYDDSSYYRYLSLWNCSSWNYGIKNSGSYLEWQLIGCLSGHAYKVVATNYEANDDIFTSCEKMYDVRDADFGFYALGEEPQILEWSTPWCAMCEAQGNICRLKNDSTDEDPRIECLPSGKGTSRTWVVAVVVVAGTSVLMFVISSVLYLIIRLRKKKEDQEKIEKFLDDYRALRPSRFSYADVKKITDNFKDKLGEGGYGTVYKGNICNEDNDNNSIPVAVKVLHNFKGNHNNNGEEFVNEVGTIGTIHHVNVVRLIGYCADGYRGALLYEFLPNGSLERLLSSRKLISTLGNWVKLQDIAIGVAKGLDYLHQGCNQRILHFDIKPQNILLDQNFNPKVSDFGLAKLCSKDQSAVSMTAARGTIGYIAPEVFSRNFGNVSYKSDVYSFGMLLVDMVGGRKTIRRREIGGEEHEGEEEEDHNGNSTQMYFPEWMYKKLEKGDEIKIQIDNNQEEEVIDEESVKIFKKLAMVGLWCIQWCPVDRPSMKVAIQMLEGENLPAMPPNPFGAASRSKMQNAFMTSISEEIHESDIEIS